MAEWFKAAVLKTRVTSAEMLADYRLFLMATWGYSDEEMRKARISRLQERFAKLQKRPQQKGSD